MLFALAAILTATVVAADPTTSVSGGHGAVAGTVTLTDAVGQTVEAPGVELTLTCAGGRGESQATTASDEHGAFRFTDLRSGSCSLSANLQGFQTVTTTLVLRGADTPHVEIHLDVAPVDAGIRVVGASTRSWHTKRSN